MPFKDKKALHRKEKPPKDPIEARGYASELFRMPAAAQSINSGSTLMPLPYLQDILVDRFDVRLLLEDEQAFTTERALKDQAEILEEKQAELERFRALHEAEAEPEPERCHSLQDAETELYQEEEAKRDKARAYQQVSFTYTQEQVTSPPQTDDDHDQGDDACEIEDIIISASLVLDPSVVLPNTQRQYDEMEDLARVLCNSTEQRLIMLRVVEKNNAWRQFVQRDHKLYPLFEHLLEAARLPNFRVRLEKPPPPSPAKEEQKESHEQEKRAEQQLEQRSEQQPAASAAAGDDCSSDSESDCELHALLRGGAAPDAAPEPKKSKPQADESSVIKPPSWLACASSVQQKMLRDTQAFVPCDEAPYIVPPPDAKANIDRVALYIARNGEALEAKLFAQNATNPKFAFLFPTHQYHRYFRDTVSRLRRQALGAGVSPYGQ